MDEAHKNDLKSWRLTNGQIMAIIQMYWQETCSRYFVADEILRDALRSVLKAGLLQIDIRSPTPQLRHKMG